MSNFGKYAAFYDLLYRDKDYAAEAEYVARMIRTVTPRARTVLELGSGTGRHGRLLAAMGFDVFGIERSADMVLVARTARQEPAAQISGSFSCEIGDICDTNLGRTFDAVVALFHVVCYQTTKEALRATFQVAANHLAPDGLFLFDVWHGPAVLAQGPSQRTKQAADARYRVTRTARPEIDTNAGTVKVTFEMDCEELQSAERVCFSEEHLIRYIFPNEVDILAEGCGLRPIMVEEFLTGHSPSPSTWSVIYGLQRQTVS